MAREFGPDSKAQVDLPRLDEVKDVHHSYQLVYFNADRANRDHTPAQTQHLEFYANHDEDYPNANGV
jgi:hypothetical protein